MLITLLFWVCTILLCLAAVGTYAYPGQPRWYGATFILIVIDLVILGFKVVGH